MGAVLENSLSTIMTEERLRAHWFGGPQVPFWNYDPAQLTVGLEIEYFIAKVHGSTFTLATKNQYLEVIRHLIASSGYRDHRLIDQPGRISKDTARGFIAIKPDFAWHILEIALPPRQHLEEIRELLKSTFAEVDAALAKVGLERLDMSCLPEVPESMDLVDLRRLRGYIKNSETLNASLRIFPALIAATHVHINCANENALNMLPTLYLLENEAQSKFVRATKFQGKNFENVRTYLYEHALGSGFLLRTTPSKIPNSLVDYVKQFNLSTKIFPSDPFFPVRDMSYIRPSRQGTFEFRSACSFREIDKILAIASFRLKQTTQAQQLRKIITAEGNPR